MPTELETMALAAVAATPPECENGAPLRMRAVAYLRNADGSKRDMRQYIRAVDWALAHPSAANLPVGSVVATEDRVFIATHAADDPRWLGTDRWHTDEQIDELVRNGDAEILRVGALSR